MGFNGNSTVIVSDYVFQVLSATFSGPFASSQITSILIHRIGRLVTIEIPALTAGASLTGVSNASAGPIVPSAFRPQSTISGTCVTVSNGLNLGAPGKLVVDADGTVKIYSNLVQSTLFSTLGINGWERCSISYIVA